jgi:hypothetical protein
MIKIYKHDMTHSVNENELDLFIRSGWSTESVKAVDEVIRLKPPVKSKATERALEEANATTNKGDE